MLEEYRFGAHTNRVYAKYGSGVVVDETANAAAYDEQDRLLEYGGIRFGYTANGELDVKENTKRWPVGVLVGYLALGFFCAFGIEVLPGNLWEALVPYAWVLGPPANLFHGIGYAWTSVVGTALVANLLVGMVRARSRRRRLVWGVCLVAGWASCGSFFYAPWA